MVGLLDRIAPDDEILRRRRKRRYGLQNPHTLFGLAWAAPRLRRIFSGQTMPEPIDAAAVMTRPKYPLSLSVANVAKERNVLLVGRAEAIDTQARH